MERVWMAQLKPSFTHKRHWQSAQEHTHAVAPRHTENSTQKKVQQKPLKATPQDSDIVWAAQALALALSGGGHHQTDDEAVESQGLGEDEDQDRTDEKPRLLGVRAHASISHNADGQTGCQ
ncbi:unnamed protein product [Polarella glacialis]|uniref:Uncharacterized protein n=1 Tax=Polarella glacialis TaxID=89957 RepID=A0A813DK39_POLGL|nr:unnamed protein product [Polarella glacialis]